MPPKKRITNNIVPDRFIHPVYHVLDADKFRQEFSLDSCPEVLCVTQYVESVIVYLRKTIDLHHFQKRNPQFFQPDVMEWLTVRVGDEQSFKMVEERQSA